MNEAIIHGTSQNQIDPSLINYNKRSASFGDFTANLLKSTD